MSHVAVTARVPHRSQQEAFDLLADFERYPDICPEVRSVTVSRDQGGRVLSSWVVSFRDGVLMWTEEDHLDAGGGSITFTQVDGDFEEFHGSWSVVPVALGSEVSFIAEFDLGITSLRSIIEPIAERSLRENIELILLGVLGEGTEIVGPDGQPVT